MVSLEDLIERFQNSSTDSGSPGHISSDSNAYGINVLQRLKSQQMGDEGAESECAICFESAESAVLMPCMHMACRACVLDYLQVCLLASKPHTFDSILKRFAYRKERMTDFRANAQYAGMDLSQKQTY
jgi:hypothetical protein